MTTYTIKTRTLIEFEDVHVITGPADADAAVKAITRPDYRMCFPPRERVTTREEFQITEVIEGEEAASDSISVEGVGVCADNTPSGE